MAQKKRQQHSNEVEDDLARAPLQAVLLADSFAQKFRPITLERPKVLLPLVNAPMIDYALAWLESVGVDEVFVFCCAHSRQVRDYLDRSQWGKRPASSFSVTPVESQDAISVGDALRVIYNHGMIHGDFILISGDTISNMSLTEALHEHKERRKKDPLAVMTMVIKHSKPSSLTHQTRLGNDEILMAIDSETKELLFYEDKADDSQRFITLDKMLPANNPTIHLHNDKQERRKKDPLAVMTMVIKHSKPSSLTHQTRLGNDEVVMAIDSETKELLFYEDKADDSQRFITLDKMLLANNPTIHLHNDKQDCYIDICSPEVLSLFTDNFDYQHIRRHFVKGLLVDDLMGYKIFTHEIHSSCAARIDNFRSYDTISKDILQRWTYPLVPEIQYFGNCSQMKVDRGGIYKARDVMQSRFARIGSFSLIGSGTIIGDHSVISNSVIGQGCTIGQNVSIQGSYIWDNVTIEDDCKLNHALVCDGVRLGAGVILEPGVILSFKVEVGQQIVVPAYSKVSLLPQPLKQDSDEELEYADTNTGVVESPPITSMTDPGNVDQTLDSSDREHSGASEVGISGVGYVWSTCEGAHEDEWRHSIAPIPAEKLMEFSLCAHAEPDESNQDGSIPPSGELQLDTESTGFGDGDDFGDSAAADFEKEVEATFHRALAGVNQDNVILEINSLRLSFNMSHADCAGALFYSIMKSVLILPHSSRNELLVNAVKEINKWKGLLKNYLKTIDEEIEVILKFEEMCLESTREFSPLFSTILNQLYDKDILSEDAILLWAQEKEGADESDKIFIKQSEKFIRWLQEASEEEEDD